MKQYFAALALAFACSAAAQTVMRADDGQGNYVRLFSKPCSNGAVLARTPPEHRKSLHLGETKIEGKIYGMCWLVLPDGTIGMLYEDGDQGRMPMQAFVPEVNS